MEKQVNYGKKMKKNKIIPHDAKEFMGSLRNETIESYNQFWGGDSSLDLKRFYLSSNVNKQIVDYCIGRNIDVKGKHLLEFGCRLGSSFLSWLSMDCEKITAIDIDEKALNLSKKIYNDLGHHNIDYRISRSYDNIPIKKEEFDIVSCNAVIEHISPAHRPYYIRELSKSVKIGGYFIVSATPNRLWYKEGHTTGVWFLNYLPFKLKCSIGSKTKKWKGKLKSKDYEKWIEQGIVGATYKEIYTNLCRSKWDTSQDMIM